MARTTAGGFPSNLEAQIYRRLLYSGGLPPDVMRSYESAIQERLGQVYGGLQRTMSERLGARGLGASGLAAAAATGLTQERGRQEGELISQLRLQDAQLRQQYQIGTLGALVQMREGALQRALQERLVRDQIRAQQQMALFGGIGSLLGQGIGTAGMLAVL